MAAVGDSRIRVVIVDDDPLVRAGLGMMLRGARQLVVFAEASDGGQALEVIAGTHPDVVLMDIRMPGMNGLDATRRLGELRDSPAVIVLTTFDADEYVVQALAAGATGFLLKDTPPPAIIDAIEKVASGEPILSPSVTRQLIRRAVGDPSSAPERERADQARRQLAALSEREHDVAVAVGRGRSNAEIAQELYMSIATVKAHVSHILVKLGATNRVQVAICVHDAGLL